MQSILHTAGAQELWGPLSTHPPLASLSPESWELACPSLVLEEGSHPSPQSSDAKDIPSLGLALSSVSHGPCPLLSSLNNHPLPLPEDVPFLSPRCLSLRWEGAEYHQQGELPTPYKRPS